MGRSADQARVQFIITKRIVQSLALAGARLEDVVHAQVYLTDPEDYSAFNEDGRAISGNQHQPYRSFPA